MLDLNALRNKLKNNADTSSTKENPFFRYNQMKPGNTAVLRFLPDADKSNDTFWVERLMINIPFSNMVGNAIPPKDGYTVSVPCMEMYGKRCPIQAEIKPMWDDATLKDVARTYYRKKTFIFSGFICSSPVAEEVIPENPIRLFQFGPQIFKNIHAALISDDMEDMPVDFESGVDFRLTVTQQESHNNYSTSAFARKSRPLSDTERAAIDRFGLPNLRTNLPAEPTVEQQNAIMEMFHASLNGELYDMARWGQFYRPWGVQADRVTQDASPTRTAVAMPAAVRAAPAKAAAPWDDEDEDAAPAVMPAAVSSPAMKNAHDVLARLRDSQAKTA